MRRAMRWLGTGLEWCGVVFLVVVSLPLIAIAMFLLRGALLVAAIVAIATAGFLLFVNPLLRRGRH